jgi:thioredoxin-like negative regulator of GroEL
MERLDSPEWRNIKKKVFSTSPSIKNLEHNARVSPSVNNRLQLAHALHDQRRTGEARELFQLVLKQDKENREALFGLGLCQQELSKRTEAIETLGQLVKLDMAYSDFEACRHLVEALWESDRQAESLDLVRRLARRSDRVRDKAR